MIAADSAKNAGRAVSYYNVLDNNPDMVAEVKDVKDIRTLAAWEKSDWVELVEKSKTQTPGDISTEAYAGLLQKKVERLFPSNALTHRLNRFDVGAALDDDAALAPLRAANPHRLILSCRNFDTLKKDGLSAAQVKLLRAQYADTLQFTNRYFGMALDEVLDSTKLSDKEKKSEVHRRANMVTYFFALNQDVLGVDLTIGSVEAKNLKFPEGVSEQDKAMVLKTARGYQRALAVTEDVRDAETLVAAGYPSALSMAMSSKATIAAKTKLTEKAVAGYCDRARRIATRVAAHSGTFIDIVKGGFNQLEVGNIRSSVERHLKEIPGFADFFGEQAFCDCKHCGSILSPAAYFADLMRFVETEITAPYFGDKPDHNLKLRNRRPDLFSGTPLTCEETHKPVPYLVIINEILENAIAADGNVYKEVLAESDNNFKLPLHLPLEELKTYLRHFECTLADIAEAGIAGEDALSRLRLGLSPKAYELVTGEIENKRLMELYGLPEEANLDKVEPQTVLSATGVNKNELKELIITRFVTENGQLNIAIQGRKLDSNSVQNDIAVIVGLTPSALDRMHRFIRLWRATGWRIGELDIVLTHLEIAGVGAASFKEKVQTIARIHRLQEQLGVTIEEMVALWSTTPRQPVVKNAASSSSAPIDGPTAYPAPSSTLARLEVSLFDRVFNQEQFINANGKYPNPEKTFVHPALRSDSSEKQQDLDRLLIAMGLNEEELFQLIRGLSGPLGLNLESDESEKGFVLSENNLSLLYRHARLSKLLKVSIAELFVIVTMTPEIEDGYVSNLGDLEAVWDFHAWVRSTKWSLVELAQIVRPSPPAPLDLCGVPDMKALATNIITRVRDEESLCFTDDVFVVPLGTAPSVVGETSIENHSLLEVTEEQSRTLIKSNLALLDSCPSHGAAEGDAGSGVVEWYCLKRDFNANASLALTITDQNGEEELAVADALEPVIRDRLVSYHSEAVLKPLLAEALGIGVDSVARFLEMAEVNLSEPIYFNALRGDESTNDEAVRTLALLLKRIHAMALLFSDNTVFTPESLDFIASDKDLFGIEGFCDLDIAALRNIELYRDVYKSDTVDDETTSDRHAVLRTILTGVPSNLEEPEHLATLLNCDLDLLQTLLSNLSLSSMPYKRFKQLSDAVALANHIGVSGNIFSQVQSTVYDEIATASAAIKGAFRDKYPDESEWETTDEPFRNALLSRRRDGLVEYLVHDSSNLFDEVSDLYNYFLLDVQLEGCARTSRMAAAIDSVQLYVHRCRMNLEETAPGARVPVHVLPDAIQPTEWEWRKNYRVWEANRKIFLHPENYIEPELRDDKTPLFKTLEEELLSKEISDEAILEAYARYLRGFDEVAHLAIAGSYHEFDREEADGTAGDTREVNDVLHLFGVTSDDPPIYYYRRVENAHSGADSDERSTHWGAWEKVDAQIPVRIVSPVVHKGQLYLFWIRYVTKSYNKVQGGSSDFKGYQHKACVEYTKRKLDGSWTTIQPLELNEAPFGSSSFPSWFDDGGIIWDEIIRKNRSGRLVEPLYDNEIHREPKEGYGLNDLAWNRLFPASGVKDISIRGINFQLWSPLDLYRRKIGPRYSFLNTDVYYVPCMDRRLVANETQYMRPEWVRELATDGGAIDPENTPLSRVLWSSASGEKRNIFTRLVGKSPVFPCFDPYSFTSLVLKKERFSAYEKPLSMRRSRREPAWSRKPQWHEYVMDTFKSVFSGYLVASVPIDSELDVVNGSIGDAIIQRPNEVLYLQSEVRADCKYHLRRLDTSLSQKIADVLFREGLDRLLSISTQETILKEDETSFSPHYRERKDGTRYYYWVVDATHPNDVDFNGAMGTYLREIFFHIPFLIANHLNSQGRFEEAQHWYHYIFDPTASDSIGGLPANLSAEERRRRERDRNWRYLEFRGLTLESLRAQLTNSEAIGQYREDPFNPHAIARLRLSAYQKAIVMKYVDNLLDWGDELFVRAFQQLNPEYLS